MDQGEGIGDRMSYDICGRASNRSATRTGQMMYEGERDSSLGLRDTALGLFLVLHARLAEDYFKSIFADDTKHPSSAVKNRIYHSKKQLLLNMIRRRAGPGIKSFDLGHFHVKRL